MKLCFIANPNSIHTRRWLTYFQQQGHQILLLADQPVSDAIPGIETIDLTQWSKAKKGRFVLWAYHVRRLLAQWQPDILHAHQVSSAGWLGWASGFHPFVVMPWGSDLYQHPKHSRMARWLAYQVMKKADLVMADSHDLLQIAQQYGATPQNCHLVQWGVNLDLFQPSPHREPIRQKFGWQNRQVILSPRSLRPIYRHEVTIASIEEVRQIFPSVLFVFRDYGADSPDYPTKLRQLIQSHNLTEIVQFLPESPHYADVIPVYQASDVVVSVPTSDGTPMSVLEAFACGVPVIASDLPSLREWIHPNETGLLVPVDDVKALAAAILHLLTSPSLSQHIQHTALDMVRERADHNQWMQFVERQYLKLARSQP